MNDLQEAITQLARLKNGWSLLADVDPAEFLSAVRNRILELEKQLVAAAQWPVICDTDFTANVSPCNARKFRAYNEKTHRWEPLGALLPRAQESVFEVVDATNEEQHWTLGVFSTLSDALIALDGRTPDDIPGDHNDYDDFCTIQIRERKYGWGDGGNVVRVREWTRDYNESTDEYVWTFERTPERSQQ